MADLPVNDVVDELKTTLANSTTALLVAPPGAGKTTSVPLHLLEEPWLEGRKIVMLEPRRLATRAAARRMAETTGTEVGALIGFQTRDERHIGEATRIEVVTEGVLTRRLQNNPTLDGVGLVIFDEIHERNIPTDLGIALTLDVMTTLRPDLRLLAMSATPDAETLAVTLINQLGVSAPVIESLGRQHPVDIVWDPRGQKEWLEPATVRTVVRALNETTGDILVFLPGVGEINRVQQQLRDTIANSKHDSVQILRLAGALPQSEQFEALSRDHAGRRRVVLSTDIAETSLTVDGVTVVVDSGLARVPRFDTRTGMTRLTTIPCSRANAEQRAGRAGRTEPGVAYRMWSKIEHGSRRAHLRPEILEAELTSLALDLALWGTSEQVLRFPDAPPRAAMQQARDVLTALGAIDAEGRITPIGTSVSSLPVHPRLATMIESAQNNEDAWAACLLATMIEERDFLRGRSDSVPTDINLRLEILTGRTRHDSTDHRAAENILHRARDLARRARVRPDDGIQPNCAGRLLLHAFPDRIAVHRGGGGQFQLRGGNGAWVPKNDSLEDAPFIVAVDLDGDRKNARVRLAADVSVDDLRSSLGDRVATIATITFDKSRDDFVVKRDVMFDSMRLASETIRPQASEETAEAILERVRATKLQCLKLSDEFHLTQRRMHYVRTSDPQAWPDWSDAALIASLDEWLAPFVSQCRDLADVRAVDLVMTLQAGLTWDQSSKFAELAPIYFTLPNGRVRPLEYPPDMNPTLRVRVQDLYGVSIHPAIVNGTIPLVLELLSPANRPIQVTSDLPGFWSGSWKDVRKDMAGRYPKHDWPEDPATAKPPR